MREDDDAIGSDGGVHFQRRDTELERVLERGQRVFRLQAARTAMALQVEGLGMREARGHQAKRPDCAGEQCDPRHRDG